MLGATVMLFAALTGAQGPGLSAAEIRAAIDSGQRAKEPMYLLIDDYIGLRGPFARIATAAAEAARKYQPFTPDDVTPEMSAPLLEVTAPAVPPNGRTWTAGEPVTHVVLRTRGETRVVQPTKVEPYTQRWGNAFGGQMDTGGMVAWFDLTAVPTEGDLEVVVIRATRERAFRLNASDRVYLR